VSPVRVICLGNPQASDDGAGLRAVEALELDALVRAGRPGAGLLDLLDTVDPVVLVDVTQSGSPPGTIHRIPIADLTGFSVAAPNVSSHGFGPAQALKLGQALGRPLPPGLFVGVEGLMFEPGETLSGAVEAALPAFVAAVRDAIDTLNGKTDA
jgi:hydrogenase maturation protease